MAEAAVAVQGSSQPAADVAGGQEKESPAAGAIEYRDKEVLPIAPCFSTVARWRGRVVVRYSLVVYGTKLAGFAE